MIATNEYGHIGETCGCKDHGRDLVSEWRRREDGVRRCDQDVADAKESAERQNRRRPIKVQEQENIQRAEKLISVHVQADCS